MKILAIRIKNLASLEGETEIDFTAEPLCSAGIFAITGPTGAGKSTILDALCLALYGKTPRYTQAREPGIEIKDVPGSTLNQGDVRGILRDGTADGFAEVDFKGIDGHYYRATWSVRRARNKAEGAIQSDSVTLKNITSNIEIPGRKPETLNEVARLVGLNFDQFTRSVLLAQGDFTAFMKANKDEKSSLLEKLTGTHIYSEISKKIFEKHKAEELLLRDLNLRKEGIITLNEEELKVLLIDQEILETQIKSLETDIEKLTAEINWHEQLTKLQTGHDEALATFQHATEAKISALPRQQKLKKVEHAQQTRSWADALKHAQRQHTNKTAGLIALEATIASQQEQQENLERQLELGQNHLSEKNKALGDAVPVLEQARKLDVLLTEKKELVQKLNQEAEIATEAIKQHQTVLTGKQEEFASVVSQINAIVDWKQEHSERIAIAENKDVILSKLHDAQNLLETLQSSVTNLTQLQDKIQTDEVQKTTIEMQLKQQVEGLQNLSKSYDTQVKQLLLTPIEALNLHKTETDRQIEDTIKAQSHWQLFYNALTELEMLSQKQLKDQSEYQTKQETLQKLTFQLPVEKAQKDTAYQLLQQARLASAENVETLRDALVDDQPCPVCGSTSHPYVMHNPQLENVLAQLENSYKEKEQSYLARHSQQSALDKECTILRQTIRRQSEDSKAKQSALATKKQAWEQFDCAQGSQSIADAKKADWIAEKLRSLKTKQADLHGQIQVHANRKQQVETAKTRIDQLKENTDRLVHQIKDIQSKMSVYHEQQSSNTKERDKAISNLKEVELLLSPYFTSSEWMENWKASPTDFVEKIDIFASNWKENNEKLEQYFRQKAALEATLTELENQGKSLASDVSKKAEAYLIHHNINLDLIQQRSALFEGQPAEETEAILKQAQTQAQQQLEQLKLNQQQLNIDSAKAHTQKEELTATLATLEIEAQKITQKIQDWLNDYNQKNNQAISVEMLYELLALSNDWITTERAALQIIEEEVTKSTSVFTERKQAFDIHKQNSASVRPLEEISALHKSAKSEAEEKKQRKAQNSFRLQEDQANKNRIGDLMKSISTQNAITESWSKLNEIIGSADGKKFRQVAQEYTLDVLLAYANIQLQALTSRYKMERIPASLGLQVVDQDMGDEVRTVYSLSGGESFLVSLALALGLASLSSRVLYQNRSFAF